MWLYSNRQSKAQTISLSLSLQQDILCGALHQLAASAADAFECAFMCVEWIGIGRARIIYNVSFQNIKGIHACYYSRKKVTCFFALLMHLAPHL